MRQVTRALLAGAVIALAAHAAQAAPTGEELLARSQQAERTHSYTGTRTIRMFTRNRTVTATVEVVHRGPGTTRSEYLSPSSMAGTVVLQVGGRRWRRTRDGAWHRTTVAPETDALHLVRRNYNLRVGEASSVAGRPCLQLIVVPKNPGNPSERMWVDRATGLVLRTDLLNWKHATVSSSAFRDVKLDPTLTASDLRNLQPPVMPASGGPLELDFKPVHPRYLPPGYSFNGTDIIPFGTCHAAHLRYSDGLNSISLFQVPAEAFGRHRPFASEEWFFTRVITWRRQDMAYAVLGDINPNELMRMAKSMGQAAPGRR